MRSGGAFVLDKALRVQPFAISVAFLTIAFGPSLWSGSAIATDDVPSTAVLRETVTDSETGSAVWPQRELNMTYAGTDLVTDRWGRSVEVHNFSFVRSEWPIGYPGRQDVETSYYFGVETSEFVSRHSAYNDRTFFSWENDALLPEGYGSAYYQYEAPIFLYLAVQRAAVQGLLVPFDVGEREYAFVPSALQLGDDCATYDLAADPPLHASYSVCISSDGSVRATRSTAGLVAEYELVSGKWPAVPLQFESDENREIPAFPWDTVSVSTPWALRFPRGDRSNHLAGFANAMQLDPGFQAFGARHHELYLAHALWTEVATDIGGQAPALVVATDGPNEYFGAPRGHKATEETPWVYFLSNVGRAYETDFPIANPLIQQPFHEYPRREELPAEVVGLETLFSEYGEVIPTRDAFFAWKVADWWPGCDECKDMLPSENAMLSWGLIEYCHIHPDAKFAFFSAVNGQWLILGDVVAWGSGCWYRTPS